MNQNLANYSSLTPKWRPFKVLKALSRVTLLAQDLESGRITTRHLRDIVSLKKLPAFPNFYVSGDVGVKKILSDQCGEDFGQDKKVFPTFREVVKAAQTQQVKQKQSQNKGDVRPKSPGRGSGSGPDED